MFENSPQYSSEAESYPMANLLTKLIGRVATATGLCAISTQALMSGDFCIPVLALYGRSLANDCVDAAADTCCPPTPFQGYRPIEMDMLESPNPLDTRKRR